ncbi:MAG: hypothetical protein O8C64_13040 [Candidatus Methanoperedens sp.]|nr:hypothetical protein [Candidatus Methanoperedens sp.]MCZ7403947.1 hypothetical protein [Candidatus Methanoperedens sp.]
MKKTHRAIAIVLIVVLAASFLYLSDSRKSIFTEKVGDMTLSRYDTGDVAARQISSMYGLKDIPLAKAYSAVYRSNRGTMRIWVVEASDHNDANDAFNAMNSMLGGPSGNEEHGNSGDMGNMKSQNMDSNMDMMNNNFAKPVKLDIIEFEKPDVYVMKENNLINYYYFKMNYNRGRVYWIIFDSPDMDYQVSIVKQAVMDI